MTTPTMRTGYSWTCGCGWGTRRGTLNDIEDLRRGHHRWHDLIDEGVLVRTNA